MTIEENKRVEEESQCTKGCMPSRDSMKRNKGAVFIPMELIVAGLISAEGDEGKHEKKGGKAMIYRSHLKGCWTRKKRH